MFKNYLFYIFFVLFLNNIYSRHKIPLYIKNQDKCFLKISYLISKNIRNKIEILVYDIFFLNAQDDIKNRVNNNFFLILSSQQYIYNYRIKSIDDIKREKSEIDLSFLENEIEKDYLAFGKNAQVDAIMISSATIMDGTFKKVWDNKNKKYGKKRVVLFQSNIIDCENGESLLRISDYFLLD